MIEAQILENHKIMISKNAVSDSVKYETIKFHFPKSWEKYVKTATFKNENTSISVVLQEGNLLCISENECYIPHEVLSFPGFNLSVFGNEGDTLATTAAGFVAVIKSGYEKGVAPKDPTPDEYAQMIGLMTDTKDIAQSVRDDANNGLFNGEKGEKGDTGEKGPQGDKGDKGDKGDTGDVSLDYANTTFANAIKTTKSGEIIVADNVSPVEHSLGVKLISDTITDFSTVNITASGLNLFKPFNKESTKNGITARVTEDGFAEISGTFNSSTYVDIFVPTDYESPVYPAGTYGVYLNKYQGGPNINNDVYIMFGAYDLNGNFVANIQPPNKVSITKPFKIKKVSIGAKSALGVNVRYPLLFSFAGLDITEFEPYKDITTVTENADGTVIGLKSISPNMVITTDTKGVTINADYNVDIKKYVDNDSAVGKKLLAHIGFDASDFERGDAQFWAGAPANNRNNTYRVSCLETKIYQFSYDITIISVVDGFQFAVGYYNDGGCTDKGWHTKMTIPANQQFRIMIHRYPEDTSEVADVKDFVSTIEVIKIAADQTYDSESENAQSGKAVAEAIANAVADVISEEEKKLCPNTDFNASDFEVGDAQFWYKEPANNSNNAYRVSCLETKIYQFACDIIIKAADGFRFAIGYYEDGKFKSDGNWATEKKIPANQQFRIMIGRVTENTSETADVAEFVSKIIILTNGLYKIYDKANEKGTTINVDQTYDPESANAQSGKAVAKAIEELAYELADDMPTKPSQMLAVNHRGYNIVAPENTLPAYVLSKKNGFDFVECDIRFTADGVPVLLHDETIDRTSNGTGKIADMTYATVSQYDFGSWKGENYTGTKIPTFEEFLNLCRALSLHPYLDLYFENNADNIRLICNTIKKYQMEQNITFVGSTYGLLSTTANYMPNARYGFVVLNQKPLEEGTLRYWIDILQDKGVKNIFIDGDSSIDITTYIPLCKEKGVRIELYGINTVNQMSSLDTFVTGFTTDGWEQI